MKYLKLFSSHSDYDAAKNSLDKPNVSHCIEENEVHYNPVPHDYSRDYFTFEILGDGTIEWNSVDCSRTISYSIDNGQTWININSNDSVTFDVMEGDRVIFKGENDNYSEPEEDGPGGPFPHYCYFNSDAPFNVCGNIMSLIYGDDFEGETTLTSSNELAFLKLFINNVNILNAENLILPATTLSKECYATMFLGCTNLITAPKKLPAETLANYCYYCMFLDCSSLTVAPELPATTLVDSCYVYMFYNCTNLVTAPLLPATTLAKHCYEGMFNGCTSLTSSSELPATILAQGCYSNMFDGCTSLTIAPELPATTLATGCYNYMFDGCTNLITAPELPATTLAENCYTDMFRNCTSLTTAPELPATTLVNNCYEHMFDGCSSLNYIKAMFTTTPGSSYTYYWVRRISATGTFVKNSAAEWNVTGTSGIPTGWTVQTASE